MSMSIPYEETGRRNQKARTREALVEAARTLIRNGVGATVEGAAAAASISRATAYRYFPNRDALLLAAHPEVETTSLLGADPPEEVEERLEVLTTEMVRIFLESEESYRTMLRLSLEAATEDRELTLRKGRRYLWIRDALDPARTRLTPERFERLVHAIAATIGIEALVAHTDLGGLTADDAVDVMRWSARALLRSALTDRGGERGVDDGG